MPNSLAANVELTRGNEHRSGCSMQPASGERAWGFQAKRIGIVSWFYTGLQSNAAVTTFLFFQTKPTSPARASEREAFRKTIISVIHVSFLKFFPQRPTLPNFDSDCKVRELPLRRELFLAGSARFAAAGWGWFAKGSGCFGIVQFGVECGRLKNKSLSLPFLRQFFIRQAVDSNLLRAIWFHPSFRKRRIFITSPITSRKIYRWKCRRRRILI